MSNERADPALVKAWVKGWAQSRGLASPQRRDGAFYVDVGAPMQRGRYVFDRADVDAIRALITRTSEHWVFIKACATREELGDIWPMQWSVDTSRVMMRATLVPATPRALPDGYTLSREQTPNRLALSITDSAGELAGSGRLAIADNTAIFDQIITAETHRRRGLGRIIMQTLTQAALASGVHEAVLVATPMGQELYATLGWRFTSPYLSAVIPNIGV